MLLVVEMRLPCGPWGVQQPSSENHFKATCWGTGAFLISEMENKLCSNNYPKTKSFSLVPICMSSYSPFHVLSFHLKMARQTHLLQKVFKDFYSISCTVWAV